jgi:activator of 2-hydroxyglutaryl-CoA dehydratase
LPRDAGLAGALPRGRVAEIRAVTVIAGVDVGNATTEVVLTSGGKILAAGRVPTRGR